MKNNQKAAAIYMRVNRPEKIISQTEAGKLLNKSKGEVHQMILEGKLKNMGNEYRFMLDEKEVLKIK
jgi:myo-inositol-hexaphosphate 3-phosphohydrolase